MQSKRKNHKKNVPKSAPQKAEPRIFDFNKLHFILGGMLLLLGIVIRIYSLESPILEDEATYYILGKKAVSGYRPYVDFYEMKPPLLFYSYGIGSLLFGFSALGLRLMTFLLVLTNTALITFLARQYSQWGFAFLIGSISFFLMNNTFAFGIEGVSEHFVIFYVLAGFLFLLKPIFRKNWWNIVIGGFLIAGGAMVKQTGAIFGLVAIIFLLIQQIQKSEGFQGKAYFKEILSLAAGAILMIILSFIPVILSGGMKEAIYWLIEFPSAYASTVAFKDGFLYLNVYFGRILDYQKATILLLTLAFGVFLFQFRKKYYPFVILLLLSSLLIVIPGYRYYGQYWIPLLFFLPLSLLGLKDLIAEQIKPNLVFLISAAIILVVSADVIRKGNYYFEEGYVQNSERAHNRNFPNILKAFANNIKSRMDKDDTFFMLGSQVQTYVEIGELPKAKHIYPRMIARLSDKNQVFQQEAVESVIENNYDFIIFSVTSLGWSTSQDFHDHYYQRSFSYVVRNYDPIWVYNYDEQKLYNAEGGDQVELYKPNQLISFKKR